MAMPISNTHLRVPRGFGALLEGVTREILRDQPKDIPEYATEYFKTLLKKREESGTEPSEWAAKLEDRYDSNQAYKPSDLASKLTVFNKTSKNSTAEDYSGQSEEEVSMATNKTGHADDTPLTESKEEESSPIITQAESADEPPAASADPKASTHSLSDELSNEINNSTASSLNNSYSERHDLQLLEESAIEAQRSGSRREDGDCQLTKQEEAQSESVNICAADLEEERGDAISVMEEDAEQEEALQSTEIRAESPVSQIEITDQRPEEASNDANDAVAPVDAVLDDSQNKSLVEVNFEDVPENQQTKDNNELNMETVEMTTDDSTLIQDEVELESERQEDDTKEINSNHNSHRKESIEIVTGDLLSIKGEEDHVEGVDTDNIDNNSCQEDSFESNLDFTHETTLTTEDKNVTVVDTDGQLEIEHQKSVENYAKSDVTQLVDSNVEIMEKSREDLSEDGEELQLEQSFDKYLPKELHFDEEELEEKEEEVVVEEEEEEEEEQGRSDPEVKGGFPLCEEDSINPDLNETRADKEDAHLLEDQQGTADPEEDINDKQEECSRPQEEEDIMDIPLDDPEANRAAAKIQAGFRGHMTRKKMKPEDKTEGEEVSSTGDVLSGSQGGAEAGRSRPVGGGDTSVPEQ